METTWNGLVGIWPRVFDLGVNLAVALLILCVGWWVSSLLGSWVRRIASRSSHIDRTIIPMFYGAVVWAVRVFTIIAVLARPDTWRQACRNVIDYWPEAEVPARIRSFYSKTAPFQYNQGPLGLLGLFKRQLVRLMGVRKGQVKIWDRDINDN